MDSCINPLASESDSYYDSRSIKSKKYKTIGDLKKAGINSIIQTTARMDTSSERDYLDKWLYDTHYSKKEMCGNLTDRIENITNKICYREIIKRCFNDVDILSDNTTKQILSKPTVDFITELHSISPSIVGSFIDYLMRRIISELIGKEFIDSRSERGSKIHHIETRNNENEINHLCKPIVNYNDKTDIELKQICLDMGFCNILGVSDSAINITIKITKKNMNNNFNDASRAIVIKSLNNITNKCKYKTGGVFTCMQNNTTKTYDTTCIFPKCQVLCYEKSKNTLEYKTENIIEDIFITSLFHSEAFLQGPKQDHFNEIYEKITTNCRIHDILIKPLTKMCKEIIKDKSDIYS